MTENVKHVVDASAGLVALGTIFNALPQVAAGFAIIWYAIRIGEWVWSKIKCGN